MSGGNAARAQVDPAGMADSDTTRQAAELAALRRMLVASRGCFSLSFAVCDDRNLRNDVVRHLCNEFPGITSVELAPDTPDVYRVVRERLGAAQHSAVFVLGLEASLPFQADAYPTLRALNSSRELWEPLACPVVFWLASYAAALVAGKAPDFWRYRSHQFEFVSEQKPLVEAISEPAPGFEMVDALPYEEKRFRMAELEQRIQEAGPNPGTELLPHVLDWTYELARLYMHSNRYGAAEECLRSALQCAESTYGSSDPRTAASLNNLAQLLKDTNRLNEAEPMMRRALAIDEKTYGPEYPAVAIRLNNLAVLLKATNRLGEAEPLMRRALSIDEKSYGAEHPSVATRLNNLAVLLQDTNRLSEAEPIMRRALAIAEKSYGSEHHVVATGLNNLAVLLQATNRQSDAEPMMRRALAIHEKSYGPEHPKVAIRLNNLAALLQATNRLSEAEPLSRRSASILLDFRRHTGYPHPHLEQAMDNYTAILRGLGRTEAELDTALKALTKEYGIESAE